MEHTNEFLRGMFAAYMGCGMAVNDISYGYKSIGVISLSDNDNRVYMSSTNPQVIYDRSDSVAICKPILTPLSDITDEDGFAIVKMYGGNLFKLSSDSFFQVIKDSDCLRYFIFNNVRELPQPIVDYLRSKKYDCGYLHVSSLIEAGLAVKATK
jgi:hypothetical protein